MSEEGGGRVKFLVACVLVFSPKPSLSCPFSPPIQHSHHRPSGTKCPSWTGRSTIG